MMWFSNLGMNYNAQNPYYGTFAASIELKRDAGRRAHWQDILDRMSEYPLQAWENTATSLHDLGSAYRCVDSNARGITRSQPGILNPNNGSPREGRI
jgi:hypothetical protein